MAKDTTAPPGAAAVSITVIFATGSQAITPQAGAALTALGRALISPELRPFRFRIEGHTDTVGDAGLNMALSQRRAESVRNYLLKAFPIAPSRLVAVGFGEDQLLVPTGDNTPEPRNRRVQVVNLGG
ncbi:OmpA family protein [Sediminicoccus sp. KRV36]|nr:OmpA family protein [Sediminicoccus rosea]